MSSPAKPLLDAAVQKAKGRKKAMPRIMVQVLALRRKGFANEAIQIKLGLLPWTLRNIITKARRDFAYDEIGRTLEDEAVPMAVENMIAHLEHEKTPAAVEAGQSAMTLATLRGLGRLKNHSAVKQESEETHTHVLRVEFSFPGAPTAGGTPVEGVLATPRRALEAVIDAEVVS